MQAKTNKAKSPRSSLRDRLSRAMTSPASQEAWLSNLREDEAIDSNMSEMRRSNLPLKTRLS